MQKFRLKFLIVASLLLSSINNSVKAENTSAIPEVKGFENWKPLVKDLEVDLTMLALCSQPPPRPAEGLLSHPISADGNSRISEVKEKKVSVYANDLAHSHIVNKKTGLFPAGSIIVKEKIRDPNKHALNSLGIMIKHAAGFDPVNSDWEFIFVDNNKNVARGTKQLPNCYSCHRTGHYLQQKASDFVFVSTYDPAPSRYNQSLPRARRDGALP